jgi:tellurite resistance protein
VQTILLTTLCILLLSIPISLVVLYVQFTKTPWGMWKVQLNKRIADLRRRKQRLQQETEAPLQKQIDQLADQFKSQYYHTLSIFGLVDYPGIGPGTVDRLRSAGYNSLGQLLSMQFESIPGIGPSRATDLRAAMHALVREAQSRFEAGACEEAQSLQRKVNELKISHQERATARQLEIESIEEVLPKYADLQPLAKNITFKDYLLNRSVDVSEALLRTPFPEPIVRNPRRASPQAVKPIVPKAPVPATPVILADKHPARAIPASQFKQATQKPDTKQSDLFRAELNKETLPAHVTQQPHPLLTKMRLIAQFAVLVARADGRMALQERKLIRGFLEDKFGHIPPLVPYIDPLIEKFSTARMDEAAAMKLLRDQTNDPERLELYRFAENVIDSVGQRNQKETQFLIRIASALGINSAPVSAAFPNQTSVLTTQPLSEKPLSNSDCYTLLEIGASTPLSPELIRRRFTLLDEKLDLTKAAGMGNEFLSMARQKKKKLRLAAESLLAPFSAPLEVPEHKPNSDLRNNPDLDAAFGE